MLDVMKLLNLSYRSACYILCNIMLELLFSETATIAILVRLSERTETVVKLDTRTDHSYRNNNTVTIQQEQRNRE